jgi:hypothetical protein
MGRPPPVREVRRAGRPRDEAVTPVIGAVLILGISVLGIAGVLFWGAPMIDRIQAQNAHVAMVGEFEDLRDASRELSVPDHSRFPTIVLARGEVGLAQGSRIMVTVNRDPANPNCDFRVTGWAVGDAVAFTSLGCRAGTTTATYAVSGGTLTQTGYVLNGPIRDWLFRLSHVDCTSGICAEAWLASGDRVQWTLASSAGSRSVSFDAGAIFSEVDGTQFLEKAPIIGDSVFGSDYYGFWLRTLTAGSYDSVSGSGSHQVYLSLVGNYDRVEASATRLRWDIAGPLAQAWCNSLVLTGASYQSEVANCGALAGGVRSVCYARGTTTPCANGGSPFTFRFLQARIYASIAV